MGAAAELGRRAVDVDDPHDLAVLLAEERHRPEPARLVEGRLERVHGHVREDGAVDALLDLDALLVGQLRRVREVEAELVRANSGARLLDVVAEHLAKRGLEQVRRGVVRHRREADAPRNDRADAIPRREARAAEDERLVGLEPERVDELGPGRRVVVALDPALVGDLAAARRVERRLAELREEGAVAELLEGAELREHVDLRVPDEVRCEPRVAGEVGGPLREAALAGPAGDLLVPLHLHAVAVDVDLVAALARELDGELDREAVRRREPERLVGRDVPAGELLELAHAAVDRLAETLLLRADDALDLGRRSRRPPGTTGRPARRRPAAGDGLRGARCAAPGRRSAGSAGGGHTPGPRSTA